MVPSHLNEVCALLGTASSSSTTATGTCSTTGTTAATPPTSTYTGRCELYRGALCYYLREGVPDLDEVYGVLDRAWSKPHEETALRGIQSLQRPRSQGWDYTCLALRRVFCGREVSNLAKFGYRNPEAKQQCIFIRRSVNSLS
ncbi:uncharacterized protein [Triticum aestivum]|uniref:uncharacterized protein n=1 Tax=Triticum aestivum TaxID=4565 RepID=UPI001D030B17|nr:uncharacterized protein LOC123130871 [Triticum aestivum]